MSGKVFLDFEYNSTSESKLNVLCVSFLAIKDDVKTQGRFWVQREIDEFGDQHDNDRWLFNSQVEAWIAEDFTFIAFAVTAEARSIYSLGIDPRRIRWVDLQIEWRMITNHRFEFSIGKHLVKGKEVKLRAPIPKYMRDREYKVGGTVEHSLSACIYKLLGIKIDTDHKNAMRDLILGQSEFKESERNDIMDYCDSDIIYLPKILTIIYTALKTKYLKRHRETMNNELYLRGDYAAASAIMEANGYPIDYEATRSFSDSARQILFDIQCEFKDLSAQIDPFLLDKKGLRNTQNTAIIRNWIIDQGMQDDWLRTDKGGLSLKLEAFEKHYSHREDQTIFGNKFLSYLRTKQALNGFMPGRKSKTIWDFTGKDARVRPYFGIFRAQSGRSQPSATSYIPLKSRWMRVLIQPRPGRAIVGIDYAQQEFLLAGLLSGDKNMIKAYHSGDPYLATGKTAGAIPQDGTKAEYQELRDKFKSTVLGIQFQMAAFGLSGKLTRDLGYPVSEEEAQDLIDLMAEAYPDYEDYKHEIVATYEEQGYLRNPCGWTMFGDNPNRRSVGNFPIQGAGSSIMRKGVLNAMDRKLQVILTLHDAIYVECPTSEISFVLHTLAGSMDEAFKYYFKGTSVEQAAVCRMDPTVWGPDLDDGMHDTFLGPCKFKSKYIDDSPRAKAEYKKFRKYLLPLADFDFMSQ